MFSIDPNIKVVDVDPLFDLIEAEEIELKFSGFTVENFRSPLTLQEFLWGWKKMSNDRFRFVHMPWMNLEIGSYEQVRMIFDYHSTADFHDDAVKIIQACNRVLEERYSQSSHTVGNFDFFSDWVTDYCDEGFSAVAAALRSGDFDVDNSKYVKKMVKELDDLMARSSPFSGQVWRGMKLVYRDYKKFRENGSILFKNFVSTSMAPIMWNYGIAECVNANLNRNQCEIDYDDNDGVKIRNVRINMSIDCSEIKHIVPGKMTAYPEECEIILDRNTVIVIDEIFEYLEHPLQDMPICFITARAIPLAKFNGPTLVV